MDVNNTKVFRLYSLFVENCLLKAKLTPVGYENIQRISFNNIVN
jgi:hypothetical protein